MSQENKTNNKRPRDDETTFKVPAAPKKPQTTFKVPAAPKKPRVPRSLGLGNSPRPSRYPVLTVRFRLQLGDGNTAPSGKFRHRLAKERIAAEKRRKIHIDSASRRNLMEMIFSKMPDKTDK